jgi:septum formation protein
MLTAAGLDGFLVEPAAIDEQALRREIQRGNERSDGAGLALELAEAKARAVAGGAKNAVVIGSDQVLTCDGCIFTKPDSINSARETLVRLRGRTHALHAAAVLVRDDAVFARSVDTATLTMRDFSEEFLEQYLADEGRSLCDSVGAYKLEGRGVQLFASIEGNYFTILGMPLLGVLDALRMAGALER